MPRHTKYFATLPLSSPLTSIHDCPEAQNSSFIPECQFDMIIQNTISAMLQKRRPVRGARGSQPTDLGYPLPTNGIPDEAFSRTAVTSSRGNQPSRTRSRRAEVRVDRRAR